MHASINTPVFQNGWVLYIQYDIHKISIYWKYFLKLEYTFVAIKQFEIYAFIFLLKRVFIKCYDIILIVFFLFFLIRFNILHNISSLIRKRYLPSWHIIMVDFHPFRWLITFDFFSFDNALPFLITLKFSICIILFCLQ